MKNKSRSAILSVVVLMLSGCGASLHDTIGRYDLEAAREMLQQNPELVSDVNSLGKTPLHYAVNYKSVDAMELLLEYGADLNAADKTGMTPLHCAAMLGRRDEAAWLLDHGAEMESLDNFGDTPVHTAACFGGRGVIDILQRRGAKLDTVNHEGLTPLKLAERYFQERTVIDLARLTGIAGESAS